MYPNLNQRPPAWWQIRARQAYYQQRFNLLPRKKKILYGCGPLVVVLALCSICAAISNASQSSNQPTVAQASPTVAATPTPHPKLWATAVAATETAQTRVTPTPKPAPTLTPTPQPTATPVPIVAPTTQPNSTLSVVFTNEDATDHASSSISVQTSPLAALTITVAYCTGKVATSESLRGTVYADSSGAYTWTWVPDTTCYGEAVARVTASLNGQTASDTVSFGVL